MNKNSLRLSRSAFNVQVIRDISAIIGLLILTGYVVYFTSQDIARIFFLLLLLLFMVSNKNYFWFAFFFVIAQTPGLFFADFYGASQYRIPAYTFLPGFTFTPIDFFVILAFVKAAIKGKRIRLRLRGQLVLLSLYVSIIVVVATIIFSTPSETLAWNLRWFFYYSLIISFLYLMYRKQDIYRFILLVSPLVFFVFFTQIYYGLAGNEFINLFNPGFKAVRLNTVTGELRPVMGGVLIPFFSLVFSIFLLVDEDFKLPKIYLYFVMVTAFLSAYLSATRLWFVIFSFIFAGYILVSKRKIISIIGVISIFLFIISILMYAGSSPLGLLFQSSWLRLQQIFDVAAGNFYSVDTARFRLLVEFPKIWGAIKQNPIIGYGFSDVTMQYYEDDLGFFNTILMFGFIGFSLFIFLFVKIFVMLISSIKRISIRNPFRIPLKIMVIAWVGVLIAYFSTYPFFTMFYERIFFISLLIAFTEFFVLQASKEEDKGKARALF